MEVKLDWLLDAVGTWHVHHNNMAGIVSTGEASADINVGS
jgi:hypothetical protein